MTIYKHPPIPGSPRASHCAASDGTGLPAAIAYCRVSTSKQDLSMDQQQAACAQWCAAHGYALKHVLVDSDVSGGTPLLKRPEGRDLIDAAQRAGAQVVVSTYIDRLFRDTLDGLRCMREVFAGADLRVVLVNESIDLSTAQGRMNATMRLAMCEYERELIGDRTRRTSARLQADGRVYGHVPYGCVAQGGNLRRHGPTWARRELIVRLMAAHPVRQVQGTLRAERVLSPTGSRTWSLNTLSNLVATHARLSQLPMATECGAGQGAVRDARVSA